MNDYTLSNNTVKLLELKNSLFKENLLNASLQDIDKYNSSEIAKNWEFRRLYRPVRHNMSVDSFIIPVANGASVTGFLYRRTKKQADDSQAVIVYVHSGGWIMGNIDITGAICSNICDQTGAMVLAVDYRLAPKFKFPTPIEDCYNAFLWAQAGAKYWKANPSKVFLMGSACGAAIAASVCQIARDRQGPVPAGLIMIDPVTDCRLRTSSCEKYKDNPVLTAKEITRSIELYQREPKDILDPLFSPLESKDLSRMPDTLILAAEYDILYDDAVLYEKAMLEGDSNAKLITRKNALHGLMDYPNSDRWKDYMTCVSDFVQGVSVSKIELTSSRKRLRRLKTDNFLLI